MLRAAASRSLTRAIGARSFADVAQPAVADFDWDAFGSLIHSDEGKRELQSLRTTYLDIKQRLGNLSKAPEPIKWDSWKADIDPKLVDQFKTAFETMNLPKYEGNEQEEAKAKFAAIIKEAEALTAHSEQRITEIKAEIKSIQDEKARIASATIDDELAADPKLAAQVDKEIADNHFMVL